MFNVLLIFTNVFQKLPLLELAFAKEPWEEHFSENYQISNKLRKLVPQKFVFKVIALRKLNIFQSLVFKY